MADMRIRFLVPYVVRDHRMRTPEAEQYEEGQEVTLPEASAQHFLSRHRAVLVGPPTVQTPTMAGPVPASLAEERVPATGHTMPNLPPERQPLPDLQTKIVPEPTKEKSKR